VKKVDIDEVIRILKKETKKLDVPIVTLIAQKKDPFKVLISTVLSARTKDEVTSGASKRLFKKAPNLKNLLRLKVKEIEKLIYPVGFYKTKAKNLYKLSRQLKNNFKGKIPETIEELTTLPGVGRKTANLVVTLGFRKHGICVDTHVHKISNRLGYVKTKTPHQTEFALRKKLPKKYWIIYNDLLVMWGQSICRPINSFI
jgi:endonuclease-3